MNNGTPLGLVSTSAGGSSNLLAYLNAQYAGGAGAGGYVFLRINSRDSKTGVNYATLTMSEGGVTAPVDTRPRISYQAVNPAPTITSIPDQVLGINTSTDPLAFTIGDDATPVGPLALSSSSSNTSLVPHSNIVFGGSGANRTVTVNPASGLLGTADITVEVSDGVYTAETTFTVTVELPTGPVEVMAGWDHWDSNVSPNPGVTASGIIATATSSTAVGNWNTTDDGSSGRGSSGDQTWGSFSGNGFLASSVTSGSGVNMAATNGVVGAEVTFTITNNGATDWNLNAFHMDVIAFRPNAPRAYQLEVLSGGITNGVVFVSADDEINQLGGTLSGSNDDHDEIDLDLSALADSTLEPGEMVVLQITFSSGTGSGGGHHLFLDNVAVSGRPTSLTGKQSWRLGHFGTIENTGIGSDFADANGDGESNLLEYATHQNPHEETVVASGVTINGEVVEFLYTRSLVALADGMSFHVEWSDTLLTGSWSQYGVVYSLHDSYDETQTILASIPVGAEVKRFVRLVVTP